MYTTLLFILLDVSFIVFDGTKILLCHFDQYCASISHWKKADILDFVIYLVYVLILFDI